MTANQAENGNFDLNLRNTPPPEKILEEIGIPENSFAANAIHDTLTRRAAGYTGPPVTNIKSAWLTAGHAEQIDPAERSGVYRDWVTIKSKPASGPEIASPGSS